MVTERLYREHPDLPEGQLAKLRASVVNMHALAGVAAFWGFVPGPALGAIHEAVSEFAFVRPF